MAQSIAINSLIAVAGRAVQVALGLVVVGLLTRLLGESGFGTYSTLLAYGSLLLIGADFGLYLTLTRQIGQEPERLPALLSDVLWLRLAGLVVVFILGYLILPSLSTLQYLALAFWIAAAGLAAQSFSQLLMGVFQARSSIWRASAGDLVGRLAQISVIAALPFLVGPLFPEYVTGAVVAFAVGAGLAYLVHLLLAPLAWPFRSPPPRQRWQSLIALSWPAAAMLILNAMYFRIDILMLSFFRPAAEVGLYGLAGRLIESALFLPAMFGGLLLPHLSKSAVIPAKLFDDSLRAVILAGTGLCVLLALLATPLVELISGSFPGAGPLLSILSLALLVMFLGNLFGFTLVARGRQKALMWLYASLVVLNIVSNLILIPRYGAFAAAWVTVATEVVSATVAGWLVYRLQPFRIGLDFVGKVFLVVLATGAALLSLPSGWPVLGSAALGAGIFAGLSVWLKLVHPAQFTSLWAKP